MFYEIAKCQRLRGGEPGDYYLLVNCWLSEYHTEIGLPPFLVEDFHIRRAAQGRRIVTNAQGWYGTVNGAWVDPTTLTPEQPEPRWAYETFSVDLRAEFKQIIETTLERQLAAGWAGDRTGDATKPLYLKGVLVAQRTTSKPLEGDGREIEALRPSAVEMLP